MVQTLKQQIDQELEPRVKAVLNDIARTLVGFSPVKSGAYVNSHGFEVGSVPMGQGFTKHGKPIVNKEAARREALAGLTAKINSRYERMKTSSAVYFANDAPHVEKVEYVNSGGHYVYSKARNIYG
jgi:hypothetical protein